MKAIRNHIQQLIPKAREITVKVEKDHRQFVSKIHVQMPGKVLHATKRGDNPNEAIYSSYHAVLCQLKKSKKKKKFGRRGRAVAPPPITL